MRAGVFAAVSTLLAVGAHRLAGGTAPGGGVTALAMGLLLVLGVALSRRERNGTQIAILVLATQALLHLSFMLTTMSSSMSGSMSSTPPLSTAQLVKLLFCFPGTASPSQAQVDQAMANMDMSHLAGASAHMAGAGGSSGHMAQMAASMSHDPFTAAGLGMLIAHLAAAGLMAWWLRRGERAAWAVIERAVRGVTFVVLAVVTPTTSLALRATADMWRPTQQVWGSGRAGRGPPIPTRLNFLTA